MPVYAVLCYTVAKHGLCWVCKRRKSTPFTYVASVVFLKFDGNRKSLTKKCWDVLDSPLCTIPSASVDFAGLVMFWQCFIFDGKTLMASQCLWDKNVFFCGKSFCQVNFNDVISIVVSESWWRNNIHNVILFFGGKTLIISNYW